MNLFFVDLFTSLQSFMEILLTEGGIHLNDFGYRRSARVIDAELNLPSVYWQISINSKGKVQIAERTKISNVEATNEGLKFNATDYYLPVRPAMDRHEYLRVFSVDELSPGHYSLRISGTEIDKASDDQWSGLNWLSSGPEFEQEEKLRRTIVEKNLLYFHSWRPQNVTYLFLFRKHEQGQNAKEVEEFRKLVAEKEKEIARLKKPLTHTYELFRVKESKKQ